MSDRVSDSALPTLEQRIEDIRTVLDAVGSERAAIFGVSEGGNMSLLFAATYPERAVALVTFGIFAKRIWSPDYPWAPTPEQRQKDFESVAREWQGGMRSTGPRVRCIVQAPDATPLPRSASGCARASTPGECEVMRDKLRGLVVHMGARVAALAGPGEILVSSTVQDLVAGSGLRFADRGLHAVKGVPGTWRLFVVER